MTTSSSDSNRSVRLYGCRPWRTNSQAREREKASGFPVLDHGNALSAGAVGKSMGHKAVQQHAAGKGCQSTGDEL